MSTDTDTPAAAITEGHDRQPVIAEKGPASCKRPGRIRVENIHGDFCIRRESDGALFVVRYGSESVWTNSGRQPTTYTLGGATVAADNLRELGFEVSPPGLPGTPWLPLPLDRVRIERLDRDYVIRRESDGQVLVLSSTPPGVVWCDDGAPHCSFRMLFGSASQILDNPPQQIKGYIRCQAVEKPIPEWPARETPADVARAALKAEPPYNTNVCPKCGLQIAGPDEHCACPVRVSDVMETHRQQTINQFADRLRERAHDTAADRFDVFCRKVSKALAEMMTDIDTVVSDGDGYCTLSPESKAALQAVAGAVRLGAYADHRWRENSAEAKHFLDKTLSPIVQHDMESKIFDLAGDPKPSPADECEPVKVQDTARAFNGYASEPKRHGTIVNVHA